VKKLDTKKLINLWTNNGGVKLEMHDLEPVLELTKVKLTFFFVATRKKNCFLSSNHVQHGNKVESEQLLVLT